MRSKSLSEDGESQGRCFYFGDSDSNVKADAHVLKFISLKFMLKLKKDLYYLIKLLMQDVFTLYFNLTKSDFVFVSVLLFLCCVARYGYVINKQARKGLLTVTF